MFDPWGHPVALRPHLTVERVDHRRVLLLGPHGGRLLAGPLFAALVPAIDGQRSGEALAALLNGVVSAPEVLFGLRRLLALDLVAPAGAVDGAEAAGWSAIDITAEHHFVIAVTGDDNTLMQESFGSPSAGSVAHAHLHFGLEGVPEAAHAVL